MRDTPFLVFVVYQEIDCIDISYIIYCSGCIIAVSLPEVDFYG